MADKSHTWTKAVVDDIHTKAKIGRYRVRGYGAYRHVPAFDDLVFLSAAMSRMVVEPHLEDCNTATTLGSRFASEPLTLDTPIIIAPMSWGALSKEAKIALAKGAAMAGTASATGEGGMMDEEREAAKYLFYQCTPGRYGFHPRDLLRADAIDIAISQGAKPGVGGHLMGSKIDAEIATQRGLPLGIDLRSPSRHPDFIGADDLVLKVLEFREATGWRKPISLKVGAGRVIDDVQIMAKVGVDIVQIDGMEGGTGAAPEVALEHIGIPTIAALVQAVAGLRECEAIDEVDIVIMGGIRNGSDAATAIAMGAKAVAIGTAALIAMGCTACMLCATGKCPEGLATQDVEKRKKFDIDKAAEGVANFIDSMTAEMKLIARVCGKTDVHNLEPEDLRALTMDVSAITGIPMVGSDHVVGSSGYSVLGSRNGHGKDGNG